MMEASLEVGSFGSSEERLEDKSLEERVMRAFEGELEKGE